MAEYLLAVTKVLLAVTEFLLAVTEFLLSVAVSLMSVAASLMSVAASLLSVAVSLMSVAAYLMSVAASLMKVAASPFRIIGHRIKNFARFGTLRHALNPYPASTAKAVSHPRREFAQSENSAKALTRSRFFPPNIPLICQE